MNSFLIYNLHATTFAIACTPLSVLVALDQPLFFNFSKLIKQKPAEIIEVENFNEAL